MKTVVVAVSFALALGSACPAQAGYYTGNEMLKMCLDRKGNLESGICLGFVAALGATTGCLAQEVEEGGEVGYSGASLPSGVTPGQLKKVAIKWMEAHPEQLHHDAADLVSKSFQDAFPSRMHSHEEKSKQRARNSSSIVPQRVPPDDFMASRKYY